MDKMTQLPIIPDRDVDIEAWRAVTIALHGVALVQTSHRPIIFGSAVSWATQSIAFTANGFFQS